jgi:hypothetical protein
MELQDRPSCPACGHAFPAQILYGLPELTPELEREVLLKRVALGGCLIDDSSPNWQCFSCGHAWGKADFTGLGSILDFWQGVFEADQTAYLDWQRLHPAGFVLSRNKNPKGQYTVHRSQCIYVSQMPMVEGREKRSGKVCVETWEALRSWAEDHHIDLSMCNYCSTCQK